MRVALIYGGRSTEHHVSVASARNIHQALLDGGHEVISIAITLDGQWYLQSGVGKPQIESSLAVSVHPGIGFSVNNTPLAIDVAIAPTHGWGGEDGKLQGLCELCSIPLVGCDTLASGVGMYKMVAQHLFAAHGIPTVPSLLVEADAVIDEALFTRARKALGPHLFAKAESSGSSVGIAVLKDPTLEDFIMAVSLGRRYSERVLVQTLVSPLIEVECAILQKRDDTLVAAGPGRVVDPGAPTVGYLDYHHKYATAGGAYMEVPSGLGSEIDERIRSLAKQAFVAIKGNGSARVDFFVSEEQIYLNEINTAPGMTSQSHWPALLKAGGFTLTEALDELLAGTLSRYARAQQRLYTPPEPI